VKSFPRKGRVVLGPSPGPRSTYWWVFHFTPTSASWLNAVEGFFAKLTKRRLKRGVFKSIVDLQAAINRFLAETNDAPRPFTWTADPDKIIASVRRGRQALDTIH
jgi:transposase